MSAAAKFSRRGMFDAYMAGMLIAHRSEWMHRARTAKEKGYADLASNSVKRAREANHEALKRLHASGAPIPFADYDRERQISATGAFGRVPYHPPAGSIEP